MSDTYSQNNLGYQQRNNQIFNQATFRYEKLQPFGKFLSFGLQSNIDIVQLYNPRVFTELVLSLDSWTTFTNRFNLVIASRYRPLGYKDYYEPRVEGRYYHKDKSVNLFISFHTDRRKKLSLDGRFIFLKPISEYNQRTVGFELNPHIRYNDRLDFSFGLEYQYNKNNIGYVANFGADSVFFGKRNSPTWITTISGDYIFTNTLSLGFNLRHYWSRVMYDGIYYFLDPDGTLTEFGNRIQTDDINYNAFAIDLVCKWNFAPGSWLTAVWKNIIDAEGELINNYFDNVDYMFNANQVNSVSLKLLYYLDYQHIKNSLTR